MTDLQAFLLIVGLILLGGLIVACCDYRDPNVLEDSVERRQMRIKDDTTGWRA